MSHTANTNTYLFSFPPQQQQQQQHQHQQVKVDTAPPPAQQPYPGAFSSSPASTGVDAFDFDSPLSFEFENTFGLSPSSSSVPSTNVVSPKSATLDFNLVSDTDLDNQSPTNLNTAEALSSHHLQRYLHYKALAEQAEAQHKLFTEQLESLFTFGMPVDPTTNATVQFDKDASVNMMAFQPQQVTVPPPQQQQQQPIYGSVNPWQQQQQLPAQLTAPSSDLFHAQAQTHLQAHQAAQAAQVSSMTSMPTAMSTTPTYFIAQQQQQQQPQVDSIATWSRQSTSSIASVSAPTTPAAPLAVPMMSSMTAPTVVMSSLSSTSLEGESELDRVSVMSDEEMKPHLPMDIPLTNLNGGGRGYVPGQTPDDPKKRHKCTVCGRGFARAFNLKSHIQTHNPLRSKPHSCPHGNCRRGFSRLHDLERHRQGIHNDGPLVEAKYQGVAPSVARAKDKIQKRAESGSLI